VTWTLAEAQNEFEDVLRRAMQEGPQIIVVDGKEAAVVLSMADYHLLRQRDADP
jgi:prevent-host-death family protein